MMEMMHSSGELIRESDSLLTDCYVCGDVVTDTTRPGV